MSRCALIVLSAHLSQLNWNQPCLKPAFRLCSGDLGCMMLQLLRFQKWGFHCKCIRGYFNIPRSFVCFMIVFHWPEIIMTISLPLRRGGELLDALGCWHNVSCSCCFSKLTHKNFLKSVSFSHFKWDDCKA